MKHKYTITSNYLGYPPLATYGSVRLEKPTKNREYPDEKETIAVFYGPDAYTNAQKVCDLLNEVSRSQGKF